MSNLFSIKMEDRRWDAKIVRDRLILLLHNHSYLLVLEVLM